MPGGDIAKGIAKSAQKAVAKTAVKVGAELADDAAKVIKGSTAAAADGLSSAKKTAGKVHAPRGPPNPNGRKGGLEHQAKVAELVDAVKQRGLVPVKEYRVKTPNGHKENRFVDVAGLIGVTPVEMHQVGKQTKGGRPVIREVDALDDIEGAKGTRPTFHPYNK